jgi:chemotaxis protein MotA
MNSNGIGFVLSILMLIGAAVWTDPDHPWRYLDAHGAYIVVFGTACIAVISVPWHDLRNFFKMVRSITRKSSDNDVEVIETMVKIAEAARVNIDSVRDFKDRAGDPFLGDAIEILLQGFDETAIAKILRRRIEVQKERENTDAKMFKNLGKYPPAAGLIGTVMGMMTLLGSLGQEGAAERIGPSMSVALAATLYGVLVANMLILPVADNLMFRTQKSIARREMIIEGIILIKQKTTPSMVREILLSHVSPSKRALATKNGKAGAPRAA